MKRTVLFLCSLAICICAAGCRQLPDTAPTEQTQPPVQQYSPPPAPAHYWELILTGRRYITYQRDLLEVEYSDADFGITPTVCTTDFDGDGIDDLSDLLAGAKLDAAVCPTYDAAYYGGGYPPDDIGVCADVVWRAFKSAGLCLRDMVDRDVRMRPAAYTKIQYRDNNIDFRRVPNLHVFFDAYAQELTTDIRDIDQWQAGDIVIFKDDGHIGIVSDIRNWRGQPFIIHNAGQPDRDEDYIRKLKIIGHYRFDLSLLPEYLQIAWHE